MDENLDKKISSEKNSRILILKENKRKILFTIFDHFNNFFLISFLNLYNDKKILKFQNST